MYEARDSLLVLSSSYDSPNPRVTVIRDSVTDLPVE